MRRLLSWLRLRRLTAARQIAYDWERRALDCFDCLHKHAKKLERLRRKFELLSDSIREDLDMAVAIQSQQANVVESLRQENEVLSKVLVPSLTAAHQLLLQRYDAETAIQVRLRVAATTDQRE